MTRLEAMLDRLPAPYSIDPGARLHDLLAVVDLQLAVIDEDRDRIQRSHWIDSAFERVDLARLGALFEVGPVDWEPLALFRTRIKAVIAALLRGSVTPAAMREVLSAIFSGAQSALASEHLSPGTRLEIKEFPPRTRRSEELIARRGVVRPHDRFVAHNRGLEPALLNVALTGVAGGRTVQPVLVNLTTGEALGWRGVVRAGGILRIQATADAVTATLDGTDVSQGLWSARWPDGSEEAEPGGARRLVDEVARPLLLALGDNRIAVVSLARYDEPGLDAALLGLADSRQHQGVFAGPDDGALFDDAVFFAEPMAGLDAWWVERTPATFRVSVPSGLVRRVGGRRPDPEADRAGLLKLLEDTADRLRAAAVDAQVVPALLSEQQPVTDRVAVLAPLTETGSSGQADVVGVSAAFDVAPRDRSRYTS